MTTLRSVPYDRPASDEAQHWTENQMARGDEPRVVLLYDSNSISPMDVAEVAAGICRLVWLVDCSNEIMSPLIRLLRRLGDVIDAANAHPESLVAELRPLAPQGILTLSDQQIPLAAALAEKLSLPFHSVATSDCLADKFLQRSRLRNAGVPTPATWALPDQNSAADAHQQMLETIGTSANFPVVLKPRRGFGSLATVRAESDKELSELLSRLGPQAGGFLVEEYLEDHTVDGPFADDVSVELLVQKGHVHHLATIGKFALAAPFRGRGNFLPSHVDAPTTSALFATADLAVAALGIRDGFVDLDMKLTPDGPRIVEVNGRIGGNVPMLIELAGGPKILPLLFRVALGDEVGDDPSVEHLTKGPLGSVGYFAWVQPPMWATRLISMSGLAELGALAHVTRVVPNRTAGDTLDWARGAQDQVCAVFGSVGSHAQLALSRSEIDETIVLEYQ